MRIAHVVCNYRGRWSTCPSYTSRARSSRFTGWQQDLLTTVLAFLLAGCSSMSGFDAKTSFACKAPDGVRCQSMTGIYANIEAKALSGQRSLSGAKHDEQVTGSAGSVLGSPISSGTPIHSAPRILRIWFAPWEDADGDLHDQGYVYLTINNGSWLIEHNQRRISDAFQPVRAAVRSDRPGTAPAESASSKPVRGGGDPAAAPAASGQYPPSAGESGRDGTLSLPFVLPAQKTLDPEGSN